VVIGIFAASPPKGDSMSLSVDTLRSSFELVISREPNLTARFYDELFERHPEVRPLFGGRSRDRQEKMLGDALVAVLDHLEDAPWLADTLEALGRKHKDYGVTDEMYAWVGEALLATLAKIAGDAWTPKLKGDWVDAYNAIAALMMSGARTIE
jgi:hemoglobin-like flavoprotein